MHPSSPAVLFCGSARQRIADCTLLTVGCAPRADKNGHGWLVGVFNRVRVVELRQPDLGAAIRPSLHFVSRSPGSALCAGFFGPATPELPELRFALRDELDS